jgi:hypothetical protein
VPAARPVALHQAAAGRDCGDLLSKTGGSKRWGQLPGAARGLPAQASHRQPAPVQDLILARMAAGRGYCVAEIVALLPGSRLDESVRRALYAPEEPEETKNCRAR